MTGPFEFIRGRLLPALLTAGGVTLLAAGLLTYTVPVAAEPIATPSSTPTPGVATAPPSPQITLPPLGSATPAPPTATPDPDRVATRIRIKSLDIDLPIIQGPSGYPPCDVAMYLVGGTLAQPGQGRATYLFAHARPGMFEPLLRTKAADLRGLVVEVWTSDDQLFTYEIAFVRRDQTDLDDATSATTEELWMQTSQGPNRSFGYTQVIATPLDVQPADPADAHPDPKPLAC